MKTILIRAIPKAIIIAICTYMFHVASPVKWLSPEVVCDVASAFSEIRVCLNFIVFFVVLDYSISNILYFKDIKERKERKEIKQ
jgi:hypothetical protein